MNRRQKNKQRKKSILIYDMAAAPVNASLEDISLLYSKFGLVVYDSFRGNKPEIVPRRNTNLFKFKDKDKI